MIFSLNAVALLGLMFADTLPARVPVDTLDKRATQVAVVTRDTNWLPEVESGKTLASHAFSDVVVADTIPYTDTIPKRRAVVHYSDAYGTRATIHRRLSYAMLPLFALSYFTGDKLFDEGPNASRTVINLHRFSATSVAVLFTANSITGGINLWQGRHDPIDRKRKILHSTLFFVASAGFTYAGAALANQAETSLAKRKDHRAVNLVSMGLSTASVAVMMFGRD